MKAIKIVGFVLLCLLMLAMLWLAGGEERARMQEIPFDISIQSRGGQVSLQYSHPRLKDVERTLEVPAGYTIVESWFCDHHRVVFGTIEDAQKQRLYGGGTAGIMAVCWIESDGLWAYYPLDRGIPIGDGSNPDQSYSVLRVIRTDETGHLRCIVQWGAATWNATVHFKRRW